jgi:hypothetical protein
MSAKKLPLFSQKPMLRSIFAKIIRDLNQKMQFFGGKLHLNQHLVGTQCRTA